MSKPKDIPRTKLTWDSITKDHVAARHNLTGKKYHLLTVLRAVGHSPHGAVVYATACDCGTTDYLVVKGNLVNGGVTSCGCDTRARRAASNETHGDSKSDEHKIWCGMIKRCYNPRAKAYPAYGGAGVTICPEWRESYATFLRDMGRRPSKRHSIERKDVFGIYEPSNCCWALPVEQANNTTRTRYVLYNGELRPLTLVCREIGVSYMPVLTRIMKGKDFLEAVDQERRARSLLKMFREVKKRNAKKLTSPTSGAFKHGYARMNAATPEYKIWCGIIQRTNDLTNPHYGGANIRMAQEWRDFPTFLTAIGPRPSPAHSVDRLNPLLGYVPGNVAWRTDIEQANNKRTTVKVEYNGQMVPVTPLCRELGLEPSLVRRRLHEGKTGIDALKPSMQATKKMKEDPLSKP